MWGSRKTNFWKHSSVHIATHQISPSPSNQSLSLLNFPFSSYFASKILLGWKIGIILDLDLNSTDVENQPHLYIK